MGPMLAHWMTTARYDGRFQPSGTAEMIKGNSTQTPYRSIQDEMLKNATRMNVKPCTSLIRSFNEST